MRRLVYRRIRRGNPKFWPSDGALGKYSHIEAQRVWPRFRFWPRDRIRAPGWQAANFVFVDGERSPPTTQTILCARNALPRRNPAQAVGQLMGSRLPRANPAPGGGSATPAMAHWVPQVGNETVYIPLRHLTGSQKHADNSCMGLSHGNERRSRRNPN